MRIQRCARRPGIPAADNNGNGMVQLQWYTPAGTVADPAYWNDASNHSIAWQIDGTEFGDPASGHLRCVQRLVGQCELQVAVAGQRQELVQGDRYLQLGRRPRHRRGPRALKVSSAARVVNYSLCGQALLLLIAK